MWRIKHLIFVLLVLALVLGSWGSYTPAHAQASTQVRVETAATSFQVNDTFDAIVRIENVTNLTAFEIHLAFNPAVLEVLELSNGGFLVADFTVQNTFDNSGGTIDYAIAQLNGAPGSGSGALLNIKFRAKANGVSSLALRTVPAAPAGILLASVDGVSIPVTWQGASFSVGSGQGPTQQVPPTATAVIEVTPSPDVELTPATATLTSEPTVTVTPTTTAAPTTPAILGTHRVRWGETLYCIGRGYRVNPWAIARENNIRWWPYWIFPGQVLTIPNEGWASVPAGPVCATQFTTTPVPAPATAVAPTNTPTPTLSAPTATSVPPTQPVTCRAYHTVRRGETLYRIGINYGVSYEEIARVNGITNPRLIYAGQRLCIP